MCFELSTCFLQSNCIPVHRCLLWAFQSLTVFALQSLSTNGLIVLTQEMEIYQCQNYGDLRLRCSLLRSMRSHPKSNHVYDENMFLHRTVVRVVHLFKVT